MSPGGLGGIHSVTNCYVVCCFRDRTRGHACCVIASMKGMRPNLLVRPALRLLVQVLGAVRSFGDGALFGMTSQILEIT
jgi:hypothetical protein